ncbi:MAG: carbon-nitrogen family hydrolase [Theionarchaea archaeon]|nr:carbon-nitrogen family hydrolase [Theionarchaea archaeon]
MRISVIQMEIEDGNKKENIQKALSFIETCKSDDFVVLPELWSTGMALKDASTLAEPLTGYTISLLEECATKCGMYIIGSILEKDSSHIYNTLHVVGPEGLLGTYRKIHLFSLMKEDQYIHPGTQYSIFPTPAITVSGIICYDIRFPELSRALAIQGTQMLFVPAEFPRPREAHWKILLRARAIENQFFVIACNRTGKSKKYDFFGNSAIIDPWGTVLMEATDRECVLRCECTLESITTARETLPALKDIRLL